MPKRKKRPSPQPVKSASLQPDVDNDPQADSMFETIVSPHVNIMAPASLKAESKEQLLIGVHGIFDKGNWTALRKALTIDVNGQVLPGAPDVRKIDYSLVGLLQLWFPPFRRRLIDRVQSRLAMYRNEHPDAEITVIAHSFGTYLIAHALLRSNIRIHRLILCGSILPLEFPFHLLDANVNAPTASIVNECGARDVWPPLAQAYTWGYGDTGTQGVGCVFVRDRFHNFGHSGFFSKEYATNFLEPLMKLETFAPSGDEPTPAWWLMFLIWLPIKWLILTTIVLSAWTGQTYLVRTLQYRAAGESVDVKFTQNVAAAVEELSNVPDIPKKLAAAWIEAAVSQMLMVRDEQVRSGQQCEVFFGQYIADKAYSAVPLNIRFPQAVDVKNSSAMALILRRQKDGRYAIAIQSVTVTPEALLTPQGITIISSKEACLNLQDMQKGDMLIVLLNLTSRTPLNGNITCFVAP